MMLALACVLCTLDPAPPAAPNGHVSAPPSLRLELSPLVAESPPTPLPFTSSMPAPAPFELSPPTAETPTLHTTWPVPVPPSDGSGDGEGHSDHMTAMWIVMGAMVAVMVVGMGVYLMRGSGWGHGLVAQASPALVALPVSRSPHGP